MAATRPRVEDSAVRWFAVFTAAREEHRATDHLRDLGYRVFYPWEPVPEPKTTVRNPFRARQRYKEGLRRPYFNRYVFIAVEPWQGLYNVKGTPGVATIVYSGTEPLEIPASVMAELMARCDENGRVIPRPVAVGPTLQVGQKVAVTLGQDETITGNVLDVDRSGNPRILTANGLVVAANASDVRPVSEDHARGRPRRTDWKQ